MPNKKAAWTVMVYLAGDNNLTSECLFALNEMKKADPGEEINVIAQFDPRDEHLTTHRYEINRKGVKGALFDDIIDEARYNPASGEVRFKKESKNAASLAISRLRKQQIVNSVLSLTSDLSSLPYEDVPTTDDTDTGSPVTLYNFLSYCIEKYPAHHYMLVLSGHAGGTDSDFFMKDESSKGSLTFNEIKRVLKELKTDLNGQTIDIVGMDNCLMSMGEICYELRDLTRIVVGCESYSPASGWPYRPILERLRRDFGATRLRGKKSLPIAAAKAIVEEYVNYYSTFWLAGMSVSQSALNVERVERLKQLVDRLGSTLKNELKREHQSKATKSQKRLRQRPFTSDLLLSHWEAQSYNGEWYVDLYDFCDCLEKRVSIARVKRRCDKLKNFISNEFVLKSCYSGAAYQYSFGVSIYFPWSEVAGSYQNLDFAKDSGQGWLSFLRAYTLLTRRAPRGVEDGPRFVRTNFEIVEKARMMSDRMMSDRMMSDRMMSDRMMSDRMMSDRMMSDGMMSDRMMSDRMMSDRMMSDRMMSDRMMSDRMMSDRMMSGVSGNPIHSMRNPPIVFLPNECIRERGKVQVGVDRFFPYAQYTSERKTRERVQRKARGGNSRAAKSSHSRRVQRQGKYD